MPIYEYQCQSCGRQTEVMQRMSEPALTTCDDCGGDLKKLISAPAFQFKGDGWYVTDYAKKGSKGGSSSQGEGSGDKSSGDSKGDSKSGSDSGGSSDKSSSDSGSSGKTTKGGSESTN